MYKTRRSLSQNFLYNRQLIKHLVGLSSIGKNDSVFEIGPGKGIITQELCQRARKVLAVEIDQRLINYLKENLSNHNLTLVQGDVLDSPLPNASYKVFSNLPFYIEGKIIRKLLNSNNPPDEACLIVRRETALRWAGIKNSSMFSVKYSPWFEFEIIHQFKPGDFQPHTRVPAVMIKITHRYKYLLSKKHQQKYWQFVKTGYSGGRRIDQNLKGYFSKQELVKLTQQVGFSHQARPTQIGVKSWANLFKQLMIK